MEQHSPPHSNDVALSVFQRTEERDFRKAKLQEKREQSRKEALLKAIKVAFSFDGKNCPWIF